MIKTLNKVSIERVYLNIIKAVYEKPTANIVLLPLFPEDQEEDKDAHSPPLLFNIVLEILERPFRQKKKMKGIQIGKEE